MIPEGVTQDELVDWMTLVCWRKHPGVPFQPLVNHPGDSVELESGWCDIGWAHYGEDLDYTVWVHWERRVGRLSQWEYGPGGWRSSRRTPS